MLEKLGLANFRKLIAYIAGMAALVLSSFFGIGSETSLAGVISVDQIVNIAVVLVTGFGIYEATNDPGGS